MHVNGLVLAAGLSSRMGGFKPLLPLRGKTVIENTLGGMLAGGAQQIAVVLGHRAGELQPLLTEKFGPQVVLAHNTHYATTDMLTSVKAGLRALPACDAFFLIPADMPAVRVSTYRALQKTMAETGAALVFPTLQGRRKHPPLISSACIGTILHYSGNDGLRGVWSQLEDQIVTLPVQDAGCGMDMDTPEDFSRMQAYIDQEDSR